MNFSNIHNVYFIGVGGIGMSALARYFNMQGKVVAGYDKTETNLTGNLVKEGIDVHFEDNIDKIPYKILNEKENTLVVVTPAIPKDHKEYNFLFENEYAIIKRSEALGIVTESKKCIAVSGTHGKTTISSMIANIFDHSNEKCNAFLGGIAKNFDSNIVLDEQSDVVVVEADEYDRSFLTLYPESAVITAIDEDHLDIYSDKEDLVNTFTQFANQIKDHGALLIKKGVVLGNSVKQDLRVFTYSLEEEADFYAVSINKDGIGYDIDVKTPVGIISGIKITYPGLINVENAIAAIAIATLYKVPNDIIIKAVADFDGIVRRFDVQINDKIIYIDDYAHHPEELKAVITSVKELFPDKKVTGVFQPHLYTRTRDFAKEFAKSLNMLDEVLLLDIYPARELPIEGVSSELIIRELLVNNKLCARDELIDIIRKNEFEVVLTIGAGDIDQLVEPIKHELQKKIDV